MLPEVQSHGVDGRGGKHGHVVWMGVGADPAPFHFLEIFLSSDPELLLRFNPKAVFKMFPDIILPDDVMM